MLKIYHYANCDTCRKALKFLRESGIDFTALPIRETPPSTGELELALKTMGGDLGKLFNRSGQDYRNLNLKEKLPGLPVKEALALLHGNGNLVKRPLLAGEKFAVCGFDEGSWKKLLEPSI
jgi:arsenate reductase